MTHEIVWPEVAQELTRLRGFFEAAHQAGLESISSGSTDAFTDRLNQLGHELVQTQVKLSGLNPESTPADIRLQLDQLRLSMDTLLALSSRLSAQAQRALAVLFPADQVKAYSRLGGRSMGSVGSGSSYLKA